MSSALLPELRLLRCELHWAQLVVGELLPKGRFAPWYGLASGRRLRRRLEGRLSRAVLTETPGLAVDRLHRDELTVLGAYLPPRRHGDEARVVLWGALTSPRSSEHASNSACHALTEDLLGSNAGRRQTAWERLLQEAAECVATRPAEFLAYLAVLDGAVGFAASPERAIAAVLPGERAPLAAYADWLLERGDPLGDLLLTALAME